MSMMMRRSAAVGQMQHGEIGSLDITTDARFPENAGVTPAVWPATEIRSRLESLGPQRFSGYLFFSTVKHHSGAGVILFYNGSPIHARTGGADGAAALAQLVAPAGATEVACATHGMADGAALALASTFLPPQMTQPMGTDGGEVAVLLRDLAAVRHSGTVQISAYGIRNSAPVWVRILMYEGKFLGVYTGESRQLKASLADVSTILAESSPQLTLFSLQVPPSSLPLPAAAVAAPAGQPISGANAERDELIETDLVWFMSRFERAFGRLKDRRDPQADLLRAFGELTNELAGFVAALLGGPAATSAAHSVVAAELTRARAAGVVTVDLKLGKSGLDPVGIAKTYGAFPKRGPAAAAYFASASADMLTLIGRLMERMLVAFHDAAAAEGTREGCETLIREVRSGLADLAQK